MTQTLDTQEARTARIRELTDWNDGDYERFASRPVEVQLARIAANAPRLPVIDWNAPLADDPEWEAEKIAVYTDAERCERRA